MTPEAVEKLAGQIWETVYNQMIQDSPHTPTNEIKAEAKRKTLEFIRLLPELTRFD